MHIPLLAHMAAFASIVPALIGLLRIKTLMPGLKLVLALFLVNVFSIGLQLALNLRGQNNLWISHIYGFIELVTLIFVFSTWISRVDMRRFMRGAIVVYAALWVASMIFLERFDQSPFYAALMARILFTGTSIYTLHSLSNESKVIIYRDPRFWIAAGMLIASTGSLMFYALRSVIEKLPREGLEVAYSIHWIIIILANMFYTTGFLCKAQPQNSGGQLELAQ